MSITVEFFGIARQRAGVAALQVEAASLRQALRELDAKCPALHGVCWDSNGLLPGYIANRGGERFVSDLDTPLAPGESLLILSTDAGG